MRHRPLPYALIEAETHLRRADPLLADLIDRHGPCGLGDHSHSRFHVLIKTILDQQLSVAVAERIGARLLAAQGGMGYEPEGLLRLADDAFRGCGVSAQKVRYIRGIARAVLEGRLDLERLQRKTDAEIAKILMTYPGIGPWTAEIVLMFSFQRYDILPLGDLALRRAIQLHYGLSDADDRQVYLATAEKWRPYRSIASWYLWAAVD